MFRHYRSPNISETGLSVRAQRSTVFHHSHLHQYLIWIVRSPVAPGYWPLARQKSPINGMSGSARSALSKELFISST